MMRTLHLTTPLMFGNDAKDAQWLLFTHGYLRKGGIDGEFGPETAKASRAAKYKLGYPDIALRQTFGPQLKGYLMGEKVPADYAKRAVARAKLGTTESALRAGIVRYVEWGIQNESQIHYSQSRPMDRMDDLRHLPSWQDCSEFATKAYKAAGAPDPNGFNFNGLGYTGTMLSHMKHISKAMVKKGDLCVFGEFPGHHVVIFLEDGTISDPDTGSHGQESGPNRISLWAEAGIQRRSLHYLTILN